ncbi:glycosyltransferase [Candidatus Leptofilum sp.]|uniref:glycosyltransferase n=1 Tax=Candidatus Leptofilum sp. TaxID=3241576 RepID=UPI003B5C3E11
MLISVVVPAYNEGAFLRQTLGKIHHAIEANEREGMQWEIIVCDNNSTDDTAVIAQDSGATVVFEPVNQISRARNAGAAAANGEWLLFIDADSYPTPALMADALDVIEAGQFVGCGTTVEVVGGTLFNKLRMERMNPFFRLFNWSGGPFLLVQRDAFQAIGGFSHDLFAYEEVDLVIRLKRYGRSQQKKFTVLWKNPVITSGRKGEIGALSLGRLFVSNFLAVILFILHYLLPKAAVRWLGSRLLGYWYNQRL